MADTSIGLMAVVHKASTTATYGGSATALYFGLTANEFAAVGGLIVAVIGLVAKLGIDIYYKHQHLKIARQRARADTEE